ncbi:D-alanyl-D-alanine carboxypeptidase [Streptomyces armeniacus]|uniref:D-alanyl-D-alanine carboxypeptidase n=1 Tax=Streptomyces armeniacus TaxID=83291 RepID=UPI001FEAAE32|nr:D-alanyl-D-alanine carboxypeptidase [Streptomyces armeniacus]
MREVRAGLEGAAGDEEPPEEPPRTDATTVLSVRELRDGKGRDGADEASEPEPRSDATTVLGVREVRADLEGAADGGSDEGGESGKPGESGGESGESGDGDARLRAAVAAWVSGDEPGTEPGEPAAGEPGEAEPEGDAKAAGSDDEELPVRRPAGRSAETVDNPTAMFGVLRPEEVARKDDVKAAQERAERMTAAFFGTTRSEDEEPAQKDGKPVQDAAADTDTDDGEPADAIPEPQPADAEPRTEDARTGVKSDTPPETAAADDGGDGAADEPEDETPGEPAGQAADQAAEKPAPQPPRQVDHPTTAIRVPKDGASGKRPAKPTAAESEAERTSQFVPLKPDLPERPSGPPRADAPPKPPGAPRTGAGALPPEAPPAASRPPAGAPADASANAPSAANRSASAGAKADAGSGARTPAPPARDPDPSHTRQQPLPEPPPLDLLAQLTNKPPPPETPIRTAVRRVKIWTPFAVLLAIVFVVVQSVRPLPDVSLSMTAPASYAFEGAKPSLPWPDEGQAYVEVSGLGVLGSKGGRESVSIGSVAKTMTAYVILRKHPLKKDAPGPAIPIDKKAEEDGKLGEGNGGESVLDTVKEGQEISERDALSALMIPSANNIARLLARWHSNGSEAAFVKEMNEAAKELGMKDTTYTDPSGLKESTKSTAQDQVKLAKKVMEIPALVEITKLPSWTDPSGKKWRNYNTLVPFDGAIGIKTGSTTAAGGNLLFAGHKRIGDTTQLIVGAVLGQHKPPIIDTANAVSKELLIAAGDALAARTVVKKGDVVGHVDDQLGGKTPVVATEDVTAVGWPGLKVKLALEESAEGAPHTAKSGEKVGILTAGDGPGQVKVPVAVQEDLVEPGFGDKLTRIL